MPDLINAERRNNQSELLKNINFVKLITDIALLTALFSAIGYYIGWTATAGYYLTFGLSPNFIKKSIPDVLAAAWLELFLGLVGIAIAVAVFQALVSWLNEEKLADARFQTKVIILFYLSLVLSIVFLTSSLRSFFISMRLEFHRILHFQ